MNSRKEGEHLKIETPYQDVQEKRRAHSSASQLPNAIETAISFNQVSSHLQDMLLLPFQLLSKGLQTSTPAESPALSPWTNCEKLNIQQPRNKTHGCERCKPLPPSCLTLTELYYVLTPFPTDFRYGISVQPPQILWIGGIPDLKTCFPCLFSPLKVLNEDLSKALSKWGSILKICLFR